MSEDVLIPAGEFVMGRDRGPENERPEHAVYLDAFYIDAAPVTNDQFFRFCRETGALEPRYGLAPDLTGPDLPVTMISWREAADYAAWAGKRLPSEAEWEKAARGGLGGPQPLADRPVEKPGYDAFPVRTFPSNGFGCFDMGCNVWEWTADWYQDGYYARSPARNPRGPDTGMYKVIRGGDFFEMTRWRRLVNRGMLVTDNDRNLVGFRCCRSA